MRSKLQVDIRLYAELNDFLPLQRRQLTFRRVISEPTSVKDLLEGAGVPHPEIAVILVDDVPKPLDCLINRDCRVAAYPRFSRLQDLDGIPELQPARPWETRFILDVHLGKLARYLRLLGFDTSYFNNADDDMLVDRSVHDGRILLTRDRGLLMRKAVALGYFVRCNDPRDQLVEVAKRFRLEERVDPFTRCMNCNGPVLPVAKGDIIGQLEPGTRRHFDQFWQCSDCGQIYWQGSHFQRLLDLVHSAW